MRAVKLHAEQIVQALETNKVLRTDELTTMFKCAPRTLYLKLNDCNYQTSINQNRRYITLSKTPLYDNNGLWEYRGAVFSKWGRMKETITKLVEDSPMGLTPTELTKLVKATITPQLVDLVKEKTLVRRRYGRRQVYFTSEKKRQEQQRRAFELQWPQPAQPKLTKELTIQILLTIIKYNETNPEQLRAILKGQHIKVKTNDIKWLMRKYDIQKKI